MTPTIIILGDCYGPEEERQQRPFCGTSGATLDKMLAEAGIPKRECLFRVVLPFRPANGRLDTYIDFKTNTATSQTLINAQKALHDEINTINPTLIIPLGGLALWALHGKTAISTWRGSKLNIGGRKVIPTYAPSQIMRQWENRQIAVQDLRKAYGEADTREYNFPPNNFLLRPSFRAAIATLQKLQAEAEESPLQLGLDIETRAGHTACFGIAWSAQDAICIPFMCTENAQGYWSQAEETAIVLELRKLLTHPQVKGIGQNFLYDDQYNAKHWGFLPNITGDTMIAQSVLFPGMPKGLDFLASMYAQNYVYWKAEGKEWHAKLPEEELWAYNCKDACYTWEIHPVLTDNLQRAGLSEQYAWQMRAYRVALGMMLRGIRVNTKYKADLTLDLFNQIESRNTWLTQVIGNPLNIRSPKQMKEFLYHDMAIKEQRANKGKRQVSTDNDCLNKIKDLEPILIPLCNKIQELRSLGVFHSTFAMALLDSDGRMRSSFNPAGTETFRWNSSKDAFNSGANLQNIPSGDEDEEHDPNALVLPNIRKLYIPDPGHVIFDSDLAGADAQVVAWEAEDDILKEVFRSGEKIHAINAKDIFGADAGPDGRRQPYYSKAKMGCHLTNYGGKAYTLSRGLGMTMKEAGDFQTRWFDIHPGIKRWHEETQNQLETMRFVKNKFGYRRYYFDRVEGLLPQALAWIPQSTVAIVTNRQLICLHENHSDLIQLLIQVHDSIAGQWHKSNDTLARKALEKALPITIPYSDPLIIQSGLKTSSSSWGDCK